MDAHFPGSRAHAELDEDPNKCCLASPDYRSQRNMHKCQRDIDSMFLQVCRRRDELVAEERTLLQEIQLATLDLEMQRQASEHLAMSAEDSLSACCLRLSVARERCDRLLNEKDSLQRAFECTSRNPYSCGDPRQTVSSEMMMAQAEIAMLRGRRALVRDESVALYEETTKADAVSNEVAALQQELADAERLMSQQHRMLQLVEGEAAEEANAQEEIEVWKRECWAAETELTLERCQRIETSALVSMHSFECAEVGDKLAEMAESVRLAQQSIRRTVDEHRLDDCFWSLARSLEHASEEAGIEAKSAMEATDIIESKVRQALVDIEAEVQAASCEIGALRSSLPLDATCMHLKEELVELRMENKESKESLKDAQRIIDSQKHLHRSLTEQISILQLEGERLMGHADAARLAHVVDQSPSSASDDKGVKAKSCKNENPDIGLCESDSSILARWQAMPWSPSLSSTPTKRNSPVDSCYSNRSTSTPASSKPSRWAGTPVKPVHSSMRSSYGQFGAATELTPSPIKMRASRRPSSAGRLGDDRLHVRIHQTPQRERRGKGDIPSCVVRTLLSSSNW